MDVQAIQSAFAQHGFMIPEHAVPSDKGYQGELYSLFECIAEHAPTRQVLFDGECIEGKSAYLQLLQAFVNATQGEIELDGLQSNYDAVTEIEVLTFSCQGKAYRFDCSHESDWVEQSILNNFTALCKIHGSGAFLQNEDDDMGNFLYLPKALVELIDSHYC
ncbi:MAG: hypothetical protein V4812_04670 [Pseudomonadota bacterium]